MTKNLKSDPDIGFFNKTDYLDCLKPFVYVDENNESIQHKKRDGDF